MLADPVGTAVALITGMEPGLGREAAERAVTGVAGGRAVRRRLAAALAGRPGILADGRSPAPKVVGDLLLALREAGATVISPPVCAGCGKHLRTLSRLGQDWYCGGCARRDGQCSACGREAPITSLDREGQPRCARCPDRDDRDPLAVLAAVVTVADPSLTADTVAAAALRVFSKPSNLRKLAWAVEENPGLLTGDGARAPVMGSIPAADRRARRRSGEHRPPGMRTLRSCHAALPAGRRAVVLPQLRWLEDQDPAVRPVRHREGIKPPVTSTDSRSALTAWSATRPTLRNAPSAAGSGESASAPPTVRSAGHAALWEILACSICGRRTRHARSPRPPASRGAAPASSAGPAALGAARSGRSAAAPLTRRCASEALQPGPGAEFLAHLPRMRPGRTHRPPGR